MTSISKGALMFAPSTVMSHQQGIFRLLMMHTCAYSDYIYMYMFLNLSIDLSICLSIYLSVSLSSYLAI